MYRASWINPCTYSTQNLLSIAFRLFTPSQKHIAKVPPTFFPFILTKRMPQSAKFTEVTFDGGNSIVQIAGKGGGEVKSAYIILIGKPHQKNKYYDLLKQGCKTYYGDFKLLRVLKCWHMVLPKRLYQTARCLIL